MIALDGLDLDTLRKTIDQLLADGQHAGALQLATEELARARRDLGEDDPVTQELIALVAKLTVLAGDVTRGAAGHEVDVPLAAVLHRHATARYYRRMRPNRPQPLLVVVSARELAPATTKGAEQSASALLVESLEMIEVEPVVPGADCSPPRQWADPSAEVTVLTFHLTAKITGPLSGARVILRQLARPVAELPLDIRVRRSWPVIASGLALPVIGLTLKGLDLDAESQIKDDFAAWQKLVWQALATVETAPTWVFGLAAMLLVSLGWFIWLRPKPETFSLVTQVNPSEDARRRLGAANEAAQAGAADAETLFGTLVAEHPAFRPGWLVFANWLFAHGRPAEALPRYVRAFDLGPSEALAYAKAAAAAALGQDHAKALEWLKDGLARNPPRSLRGKMLFNRGCYLAQLGALDEAEAAIRDAARSGLDVRRYRSDDDLAPLRNRPSFRELIS